MENNVKFANLTDKSDLLQEISRLEGELSKKTGQDIILIAYTSKGSK